MEKMEFKKLSSVLVTCFVAALASSCHCAQSAIISPLEPEICLLNGKAVCDAKCSCFSAIFSFGSSVADTGTGVLLRVDSPASMHPYGITFPGKPSGRWSDGRLLIDFWAKALGLPYLDPFIKSGTSSFRQGANFASGGSTATDRYASSSQFSFKLALQLYHFRKFKSEVLAADRDRSQKVKNCSSPLPSGSVFGEALYVIGVGANDILYPVENHRPIEEMKAVIPYVSAAIMHVVEGLYKEGARKILVEDVYPLACLSVPSAGDFTVYGNIGDPDSDGCVKLLDDLVLMHNSILKERIAEYAQTHSPDLSIALVDTYSIRRDLMTNPEKYGFKYGVSPCCGVEGILGRFDMDHRCGESPKAQSCKDPSEYVVWDGLHYTEAANSATMNAILSGDHFYPNFSLSCSKSCVHPWLTAQDESTAECNPDRVFLNDLQSHQILSTPADALR